jgi:hypothetical protein
MKELLADLLSHTDPHGGLGTDWPQPLEVCLGPYRTTHSPNATAAAR